MKKNLFISLPGILLSLALSMTAAGQVASSNMQPSDNFISSAKPKSGSIESSKVSQKAVKDLAKTFKNVSDESWYPAQNGFVAMFNQDGIDHVVSYDKKGNWLFTVRSYGESKLPEDIRRIAKSTYYDYDINLVQEVEKPITPRAYIIQLVSNTELINLRICDGEMVVLHKFNKSK